MDHDAVLVVGTVIIYIFLLRAIVAWRGLHIHKRFLIVIWMVVLRTPGIGKEPSQVEQRGE